MKKSNLAIILALMLILTSFAAGCSKEAVPTETTEATETDSMEETIEISISYPDNPAYPFNPEWPWIAAIEEELNVKLNFTIIPVLDYSQKIPLLISTDQHPDIILSLRRGLPSMVQVSEMAESGRLLPISDYFDQMPNATVMFANTSLGDTMAAITAADGKVYETPVVEGLPLVKDNWIIRTDVAEQYGYAYEDIDNVDVIEEIMMAYKADNPDKYPFIGSQQLAFILLSGGGSWGYHSDSIQTGISYYEEFGEYVFTPTTDSAREFLIYMAKWNKNGLIDPEGLNQSQEQQMTKASTGSGIVTLTWQGQISKINKAGKQATGNADFNWEILPAIPAGDAEHIKYISSHQNGHAVNAKVAEDPEKLERVIALLDWLVYSEEGISLQTWGVESVSYNTVDGNKHFTDEVLNFEGGVIVGLQRLVGAHTSITRNQSAEYIEAVYGDSILFAINKKIQEDGITHTDGPVVYMSAEDNEKVKLLREALTQYYYTQFTMFIMGAMDPADDVAWNEFVQTINDKGAIEMMDIINSYLE